MMTEFDIDRLRDQGEFSGGWCRTKELGEYSTVKTKSGGEYVYDSKEKKLYKYYGVRSGDE